MADERLAVIIVTDNATTCFGGEAARPLHYFRCLHKRGVDVRLVVHERNRKMLEAQVPELSDRIHFVSDHWFQRMSWRVGRFLPERIRLVSFGTLSQLVTQFRQKKLLKTLIPCHGTSLVHQPTPISPKLPSLMYGLGVPVVIGPLNGAIDYPPAFRKREAPLTKFLIRVARPLSHSLNRVFPGKLEAKVILVSNRRTRSALPRGCHGRIVQLVANAVDTQLWSRNGTPQNSAGVRFVYLGRLVRFKAVDLLLHAFRRLVDQVPAKLDIIGDGSERAKLERLCKRLGLHGDVTFCNHLEDTWLVERMSESDVFVFPSLREAGGAVVMEAMSLGLPVIAANWGGPADYVVPDAGILVDPSSRETFLEGLHTAMLRLARSADLRARMGQAGREFTLRESDWENRIDRLLDIYQTTIRPSELRIGL